MTIDCCSICLESLDSNVTAIDCDHVFHTTCIDKWITNKSNCPNCRRACPIACATKVSKQPAISECTCVGLHTSLNCTVYLWIDKEYHQLPLFRELWEESGGQLHRKYVNTGERVWVRKISQLPHTAQYNDWELNARHNSHSNGWKLFSKMVDDDRGSKRWIRNMLIEGRVAVQVLHAPCRWNDADVMVVCDTFVIDEHIGAHEIENIEGLLGWFSRV